jgi:PEGA domain/Protein kinase domain
VLHQIGSGVLGPVFRTYDPQRDHLVAVKAFRLDLVPEDVARLAEALRHLVASGPAHETIVPLLDAGIEGTVAFLAMEYVAGETLDVALRDLAPASLARALPLLRRLAEAIDASWAAGVGHGALHPRDIFVLPEAADVRVTGMGIVPALESLGVHPAPRRPYSAPERADGQPWDVRADVYSLGAITHELLTRRRPVAPAEQDGTFAADLQPEQRVLVRRVLSAALAEQPEHRLASATGFIEALDAAARGEVPALLPGSPVAPGAGSGRRTARGRRRDAQTGAGPSLFEAIETFDAESAGSAEAREVIAGEAFEAPAPAPDEAAAETPVVAPPPDTGPSVEALVPEPAAASGLPVEESPVASAPPGVPVDDARDAPQRPEPPPREPVSRSLELWASKGVAPDPPAAPVHAFPWVAFAAGVAAALLVGGLFGYAWGRRQAASVPPEAATATSGPARSDTEVAVAPGNGTPGASAAPGPAAPDLGQAPAPAASQAGQSAPPPAVETPAPGRLTVRSVPSGALVTVDGRPHGTTPAAIPGLDLGQHTMLVARPGYVPRTERVELTSARPVRDVLVSLTPGVEGRVPTTGSVYVDTRPRGASVVLDGRAVGRTPVSVPDVTAGAHALRIELAGHRPVTTTVQVVAGERARVTVTLERTAAGGQR